MRAINDFEYGELVGIECLLGKTLINVTQHKEDEQDSILFHISDEEVYVMFHQEDCCEEVYIESIVGDLSDLIGTPILKAELSTTEDGDEHSWHQTWSFYKLATIKGSVDIRWCGESNGYYSEEVDIQHRYKD